MRESVEPFYRHNGSPLALICPSGSTKDGYQFVRLVDLQQPKAVLSDEAFPNAKELVELLAEVATSNCLTLTEDESLSAAKAALLPESLRNMSNWMVAVGRVLTEAHDDCYEELMTWLDEQGSENYPGERNMLELLQLNAMPEGLRIGEKTLLYKAENGFYATGKSRLWNAEELLILLLLVLSDKAAGEDIFEGIESPFLVVPYREHRPVLTAEQLDLLAQIESGTLLDNQTEEVKREAATGPNDETVLLQEPGPILAAVIAAGQGSHAEQNTVVQGYPELREAKELWKKRHNLS